MKTWEAYIRKLFYDAQRGFCPICEKPLEGKLVLEYSHIDGAPRGLVCFVCNNKITQVETHTKKLNYLLSRKTSARIQDYLRNHLVIQVVKKA